MGGEGREQSTKRVGECVYEELWSSRYKKWCAKQHMYTQIPGSMRKKNTQQMQTC